MKILVAFYSRTGTTKKVGESIAENLKCDSEEIFDTKKREGLIGYVRGGKDALTRKLTKIKPIKKDSSNYDLVIIGTPVWAGRMTPAIRTYISENKFNNVAFFGTMGGNNPSNTFSEMEEITGKKPKDILVLRTKEVAKNEYSGKVSEFVEKIKEKEI